jgi:hypothetical protein
LSKVSIIPHFIICFPNSVLNALETSCNRKCRVNLLKQDAQNASVASYFCQSWGQSSYFIASPQGRLPDLANKITECIVEKYRTLGQNLHRTLLLLDVYVPE